MTAPAIRAEGLVRSFGDVRALDGVSLEVPSGSVYSLLGPNGAGKTTTVRILATLLKAEEGRAQVAGYDVATEATRVRQHIGLTGQYASVDELLSGRANIVLFSRIHGLPKKAAAARAEELLDAFDLTDAADRTVSTYSGGMRRRLDLAVSLVAHPQVLFLDEPTTGLDPRARLRTWELVRGLVHNGTTVLLTTQYLEEADQLADRIAVLDHGGVVAEGTPDELKEATHGKVVEVRPVTAEQLADVATILKTITDDPESLRTHQRSVTASVPTNAATREVLSRLESAGIEVDDLVLRRPSLDEVFLTLTGHPAVAEDDAEDDAEGDDQ